MEEGYFSLQLDELRLCLENTPEKDLNLRVDIEIINGHNVFKWNKTKEPKYQTEKFQPTRQDSEDVQYIYGFDELYLQSNYIELNDEVMNGLVNASVVVKVMNVLGDAAPAAAAPAKGKKDAPAAAAPSEECLLQLDFDFHELLTVTGAICSLASTPLSSSSRLPRVTAHSTVRLDQSQFSISLFADNSLAEFVVGCNILHWKSAQVVAPPPQWALHSADVIDAKAKVPPTAAELRAKYLQNIVTCVENQLKVASYSLTVGGSVTAQDTDKDTNKDTEEDGGEGGADTSSAVPSSEEVSIEEVQKEVRSVFSSLTLSNGRASIDIDSANQCAIDDDIRARSDLWTLDFSQSSHIFVHRIRFRRLSALIQQCDVSRLLIPVTVRKSVTTEGVSIEGGELFATAVFDLLPLLDNDNSSDSDSSTQHCEVHFLAHLSGEGFEHSTPRSHLSLTLHCTSSLVQRSALHGKGLSDTSSMSTRECNSDINTHGHVSGVQTNRDVLTELRDELSLVIERIAQEYVSLYPLPTNTNNTNTNTNNNSNSSAVAIPTSTNAITSFEDKQSHFMQYMTSSGVFNDLQTMLRPKLVLLVEDRLGDRGRARGCSEALRAVDTGVNEEVQLQSLLSELYAHVMSQCSLVLNTLFSDTSVRSQHSQLQREASVSVAANVVDETDETVEADESAESAKMRFDRLRRQANDLEADERTHEAHELHLHRLALLDQEQSVGRSHNCVHAAYWDYALFALRRHYDTTSGSAIGSGEEVQWMNRAREALNIAVTHAQSHWMTHALTAALLAECGQSDMSDSLMLQVLSMQLDDQHQFYSSNSFKTHKHSNDINNNNNNSRKHRFALQSFADLSGYDTDALTDAHPRSYALLSTLFYMQSNNNSSDNTNNNSNIVLSQSAEQVNQSLRARKALRLCVRAYDDRDSDELVDYCVDYTPVATHGTPRRTLTLLLAQLSGWLAGMGLAGVAGSALRLAESCEDAATRRAQSRDKPAKTSPHIASVLNRARAALLLCVRGDIDSAIDLCSKSSMLSDSLSDRIQSKLLEARAHSLGSVRGSERGSGRGSVEQEIECLATAVNDFHKLQQLQQQDNNTNNNDSSNKSNNKVKVTDNDNVNDYDSLLPLRACVRLCRLLLSVRKYEECVRYALLSVRWFSSASLCSVLGEAMLRADRCVDAEQALLEANMLMNTHARTWALLCLCLLSQGGHRLAEAEQCLFQALRLRVDDAELLAEMATAFIGVDRFAVAEDLIRRAIAVESSSSSSSSPSSSSRRGGIARYRALLADVLAGQNNAADAVQQYQEVLADQSLDPETQLQVAIKCKDLLSLLGREDEERQLGDIIVQLNSMMLSE